MKNNEIIVTNAYTVGGKKFANIPVSELVIDHSYQRRLRSKVRKMITHWDYNLCDAVLVSYRDDKFYVVDGQHRVAAANAKEVPFLPCQILEGLSLKDEAARFVEQNTSVSILSPFDTFRANLLLGDPVDTAISDLCKKWELEICDTHGMKLAGKMGSISDTRKIVKTHGIEMLDNIFAALHEAQWNLLTAGHSGRVLNALKNTFVEYRDKHSFEEIREFIVRTIKDKTYRTFMSAGQSAYPQHSYEVAASKYLIDEVGRWLAAKAKAITIPIREVI